MPIRTTAIAKHDLVTEQLIQRAIMEVSCTREDCDLVYPMIQFTACSLGVSENGLFEYFKKLFKQKRSAACIRRDMMRLESANHLKYELRGYKITSIIFFLKLR